MHPRLIPFVRAAATFAVVAGTMFASAASAQVCPYNSTQGTCACPTSGAGTTCFGGQLYRASDNSCQNDARPCAANQNWNCSTTSCVCNTASFPCGGCTAASSTVGAACGTPTGGQYTNVCGACACPAGTTLCSSGNSCVTNRVCPAGTTWDPCTDTCGTPNVLLSPGWIQSGFIQVNGDMTTTAGNLRMDQATGGGQGDIYVANGKAIRVDGTGVTNINVGNWGAGGTGVDVNFPATSRICFGATCRNSWPSTTDFNPTYINATGDTMTGDLNLTGASTDLFVAGNVGIGTTTPVDGRLEVVRASTSFRANMVFGTGANNDWEIGELNTDGSFTFKRITAQPVTGAAVMTFDVNDRVGIGTATPATALDVLGTVKSTGLQLTTGAGAGRYLVSDASGNASWSTAALIGGSGTANYLPKFTGTATVGNSQVFDNGTGVGVGTASPAAGVMLDVNGAVKGSTFTNAANPIITGNLLIQPSAGASAMVVGTANATQFFQVQNNLGQAALNADTTNMRVGVNTAAPTSTLHVNGDANISTSTAPSAALNVTKSGTGNAYGIYVTTSASGNAISALRAINNGTGPGLEVNGGSNAFAANIRAGGNNQALDVAVYDHTSTNTIEDVMTVRRATSGSAAVGLGGSIGFALEGLGGSHYASGYFGSVISSLSPHNTDLVFATGSGGSEPERLRITSAGDVGVGTATPGTKLDVVGTIRGTSSVASTGTIYGYNNGSPGFGVYGRSANSYGIYGFTDGAAYGVYGAGGASAISGVYGTTNAGNGVEGYSGSGRGGLFSSSNIGVQASGSNYSVYASGGSYGVYSQGTTMGGRFFDTDGSGYAYAGYGDSGVRGYGNSYGLYGYDLDDYVYGYIGYAGYSFYGSGVFNNYGDMRLEGKHAFRGTDSWLRLNQDGAFSSGVHTPGVFAPGSLNVGGWGGWGNPGGGNGAFTGTIATGGHSPDIYYGIRSDGYYGGGYFTNEIGNGIAYVGYSTTGIQAYGSSYGGYFSDTDGEYAYIGYGRYGIYSSGELRGRADNGYSVYIGGDASGTDVELGSHSSGLWRIGFWNDANGSHMDVYARSYNTISSARFKEDVEPLKDALDKTLNLKGVSFTWDEQHGGTKDIGFIAEDVEKVLPEIVDHENQDGTGPVMSLDYEKISALLVEAIKEQQKTIEELRDRIETLEAR